MKKELVSIIIPCRDLSKSKNIENLKKDISFQDIDYGIEICLVSGISPIGRARNIGAEQAKGSIFIFLDDDISFGHQQVLRNIIEPLMANKNIGICGTSQSIPPNSTWFQRRCAKEIAHIEHSVVEEMTDVGMVATACCAVKRDIFLEVGKFNEKLLRGIDGEFSHRIRKHNYRVVLAPKTWIYHPAPRNLLKLIGISFRNGKATAFVDKYYPELNFDLGTKNIILALSRKSKKYRLWRFVKEMAQGIISLKLIKLISKIAYIIGYINGSISRNVQKIN